MRREDPYQERAKELCAQAGIDPDSRIGEGRGMPAWCQFRQQARDEHVAREAAKTAEEIAVKPQAAEFQNSPLSVFGRHDEGTLAQMRNCMAVGNVVSGVLCADGHLGYAQPVGGVIAYEKQISISGVGFDIGCGNMAVRLDTLYSEVAPKASEIVKDISSIISFGVGRTNNERAEHELFDDGDSWRESDMEAYRQKAVAQLGTVGSGNHYVDLMRDEDGYVWIGVHFGSRGLGHTSATRYLKAAGGQDGINVPPTVIDEDSELGRRYIAAMQLAGRYSYAGREWVVERVRQIIGGHVTDMVHNHHNYCISGDAIIPTPTGPVSMRDLRDGDEIYAFDDAFGPTPTRVTKHWSSGSKDIYEVRTFNRSIRVSDTHPIQVVATEPRPHPERPWFDKRVGRLEWKSAGDLRPGDIIVCAEGYYEQQRGAGEETARLIGAFLGDGWLRGSTARQGYSLGLAIGSPEEEHTEQYGNLLRKTYPDAKWRIGAPGAFGITTSHRETYNDLVAWGCSGTSDTKRVPPAAFTWSREEKLALLAGYVDADGSVANSRTSNHGRCKFLACNRSLLSDLRELAIGCGLRVTPIRTAEANTNFGQHRYWSFTMSANSAAVLPLWHIGKRANMRSITRDSSRLQPSKIGYLQLPDGMFAQTVQSVEIVGHEEVFDLSIAHPSHAFIADGIVVHNCWKERHVINNENRDLWVVRKGATPAFPGQRGFVGGSMGDDAVIIEGVDNPESKASLYSTVHGAGRLFGRKEAKRRFSKVEMDAWLQERGVVLVGGDLDESPMAYRRLPEVLAGHAGTIKILHTLRPFAVAMAGSGEFDPWKD